MLPTFQELEYFLEVSEKGNFSRAAERLGVTQPTLSLSIQKLESTLGTGLFLRSKTGVHLTKFGQRFATQARGLIDQWERMRGEALKEETEIRGRFSIGCHPSVALYSLPNFLPALLEKNTALEVSLIHDLSRNITEQVISYQIDFGIVVNPVSHPDLVIITLCRDEVSLWAGPGKKNNKVLICHPELIQTQALLRKLKSTSDFQRTLFSSNLEVIAKLVSAGAGVGILPSRVATSQKELGLKMVSGAPVFSDKICLIYRVDVQKGKAAQAITNGIKTAFL